VDPPTGKRQTFVRGAGEPAAVDAPLPSGACHLVDGQGGLAVGADDIDSCSQSAVLDLEVAELRPRGDGRRRDSPFFTISRKT